MSLANSYTDLIKKIERRLGLVSLLPHLPDSLGRQAWGDIIKEDTMVTFSRYYPRKVKFTVNRETCNRTRDKDGVTNYIIKDEYLGGVKLLGVLDIDWQDCTGNNNALGTANGYGYYVPDYGGMEATYEALITRQISANIASLYNNQIYLDFRYPNTIRIVRAGNIDVNLESFVVTLLVEHSNLQTISPTMMETFEALAQADIAKFLYMNLRYYDGLDTTYINIDLKLSELEQEGQKRDNIIEELKSAFVSASNDAIPYIWTI